MQLVIMPPVLLGFNYLLFGPAYLTDWRTFALGTIVSFIVFFGQWLVNNAVALWFHRRFPNYRVGLKRVLLMLAVLVPFCSFNVAVLFLGIGYAGLSPVAFQNLPWALLAIVLIVILITIIYESINAFEQRHQALVEAERLKKANLQSRFDALKQQVSPHFLFNSLNVLDSLIEEDPARARQFLEELSSVYRYLLRSNVHQLTSLTTELAFIQSYYHLLRTRYGSGLNLIIRVGEQYSRHQLPPLTLQLLVENAVKHNIVLAEQPLTVEILTDDRGRLVVRNNLQRRNGRVVSNGVGLSNILIKYRMLGQPEPRVEEDREQFIVTLPLVESTVTVL